MKSTKSLSQAIEEAYLQEYTLDMGPMEDDNSTDEFIDFLVKYPDFKNMNRAEFADFADKNYFNNEYEEGDTLSPKINAIIGKYFTNAGVYDENKPTISYSDIDTKSMDKEIDNAQSDYIKELQRQEETDSLKKTAGVVAGLAGANIAYNKTKDYFKNKK